MNPLAQASSENEGTRMALPGFPDDDEIEQLWRIGLFSPDDARALRKLWRILRGQTDDYLDIVLGMVAAHPVLDEVLSVLGGESPEEIFDGSTSLRRQFRQWLFETCQFPHDPPWIKQLYSKRMQDFPEQSLASTRLPRFRYILAAKCASSASAASCASCRSAARPGKRLRHGSVNAHDWPAATKPLSSSDSAASVSACA